MSGRDLFDRECGSPMSDIATELDTYWTHTTGMQSWVRQMPNGRTAIIYPAPHRLVVSGIGEVWSGDDLAGAVVAAGAMARAQLAEQMRTWSCDGLQYGDYDEARGVAEVDQLRADKHSETTP